MANLADLKRKLKAAADKTPQIAKDAIKGQGLEFIKKNFRDEGFNTGSGLKKWKPRKDGDRSRKLLTGKGTVGDKLRNSFMVRQRRHSVVFYTYKDYAEIHNEGGRINAKQRVRSHTRKIRGKSVQVKAHSRHLQFTMPKRQFMGKSAYLDRKINGKIKKELDKILK